MSEDDVKRPHPAPSFESLPPRRREGKTDIELNLQVTTPIFGGGPVPRKPSDVDLVRVPAIRGQLRTWWRALQEPATPADTRALHRRECEVWGGPADEGGGGRSPVELRVDVESPGRLRGDMLSKAQPEGQKYVLFPARGDKKSEDVQVRCDVAFHLRLRLPAALEPEVLPALRAWILFGGYGGRTRRGLGSLTVVEEQRSEWLPKQATAKAIDALLSPSRKLLTAVRSAGNDTPSLRGAALWAGPEQSAMEAWRTAAGWLWKFRQGHGANNAARQPPKQDDPNRPSISNWPEADKIRRLSRPPANASQWSHPPRHNEIPVWPRAGFGLPIIGQFQRKGRKGEPPLVEPPDFEIRWSVNSQPCDRLASPLILKALPLASGRHAPIALWLNRAWPAGGEVGLLDKQCGKLRRDSLAPFDRLVAPGDEPQFPALRGHDSLEAAFFAWLKANSGPSSATTSKNKPYKRSRR